MAIILFILGMVIGSFLNVIATRYDPDRFVINRTSLGGRSKCDSCKATLRWYELVPLVSFIIQKGRCRRCGEKLGWQYPISEIISGIILVIVPSRLAAFYMPFVSLSYFYALVVLWISVFLVLLLMSLIDFRLKIIPDEANIFLGMLGVAIAVLSAPQFGPTSGSFMGSYALLFGGRSGILLNRTLAVAIALAFFGVLIFITLGRGMGMGDLKLSIALALVFGWPDVAIIAGLAFLIGALFGVAYMYKAKKSIKSFLPFGPFLAGAALLIFLFGGDILRFYFSLFSA